MLGQTHHRRQSAGGPGRINTTAPLAAPGPTACAAPSNRSNQRRQTRVFLPGEIIFHEGDDPKGEAFIVHFGRVEIRKRIGGEDRVLRVLGKGDLLGELGLRSSRI